MYIWVFDTKPALQCPICSSIVAFICVRHGEAHESRKVWGVKGERSFEGSDGGRFFLILGLCGAKESPSFDVIRVLLHCGFEGEGGEGEVAAFSKDLPALVEGREGCIRILQEGVGGLKHIIAKGGITFEGV